MTERTPGCFATNWVCQEDLLSCRPDLQARIRVLEESDIERIANKVGEALQENYWIALDTILEDYLHMSEESGDDLVPDLP